MTEAGAGGILPSWLGDCQAVVLGYRTKFNKHLLTQPRLSMLCVMRYEDSAWREAEMRLAERSELCRASVFDPSATHHPLPIPAPPGKIRYRGSAQGSGASHFLDGARARLGDMQGR